jgi:hypothetical protein
MNSISGTIIKMLVEDKINDEQFEKLLKRRDGLTVRVQQQARAKTTVNNSD